GLFDAVQEKGGPGMDRGVDVGEVPLVGRDLAARVQVALLQHQVELLLGVVHVHRGEGDGMEGQVPGRVPRVLPLVGHGDDVVVDHVPPLAVPDAPAGGREGEYPWYAA